MHRVASEDLSVVSATSPTGHLPVASRPWSLWYKQGIGSTAANQIQADRGTGKHSFFLYSRVQLFAHPLTINLPPIPEIHINKPNHLLFMYLLPNWQLVVKKQPHSVNPWRRGRRALAMTWRGGRATIVHMICPPPPPPRPSSFNFP